MIDSVSVNRTNRIELSNTFRRDLSRIDLKVDGHNGFQGVDGFGGVVIPEHRGRSAIQESVPRTRPPPIMFVDVHSDPLGGDFSENRGMGNDQGAMCGPSQVASAGRCAQQNGEQDGEISTFHGTERQEQWSGQHLYVRHRLNSHLP